MSDRLDHLANEGMRKYFTDMNVKCPSAHCDGYLTEYDEESFEPFKAFLLCPDCESRLRIHKLNKGWNGGRSRVVLPSFVTK
jgi:hypothetical protein